MSIRAIPLSDVPSVVENASMSNVLTVLQSARSRYVPICSDDRHYVGLITIQHVMQELLPVSANMPHGLRDLSFAGDSQLILSDRFQHLVGRKARELVDRETTTITLDCPLMEAVLLLTRFSVLPVLDANGRLIGMLDHHTVLDHLSKLAHRGSQ